MPRLQPANVPELLGKNGLGRRAPPDAENTSDAVSQPKRATKKDSSRQPTDQNTAISEDEQCPVPTTPAPSTMSAAAFCNETVTNCGPANSHANYLQNVASKHHHRLQHTVGGGNCFFHAIQIGLCRLGLNRTLPELRQAAFMELLINAGQYRPLHVCQRR